MYRGSCHCKAIQFELKSAEIASALKCNCSICSRKNALMSVDYFKPAEFKLLQGNETLSVYHWGDHDVNHYFCSVCGVYPFHDTKQKPGHYRVNLACITGLDLSQLAVRWFDGKYL